MKTTDRSATYDGACEKAVFHYDPVCCGMPTLHGTFSEKAAKTIRFDTLWRWKGYGIKFTCTESVFIYVCGRNPKRCVGKLGITSQKTIMQYRM